MMHRSDTGTYGGNDHVFHICKRCGEEISFCMCWWDFMNKLERTIALALKLDIYKCLKIKTRCIKVINLIRRTPTSISGMKGVALLKRMDKR